MITSALFVSAELAESPYETGPVLHWFDVREREKNSGSWPVKTDQERSHWDWSPLKAVGPLRFGMTPRQVADTPSPARPRPAGRDTFRTGGGAGEQPGDGRWPDDPSTDRVTAHCMYPDGLPVLGGG
ncbi:putative protein OS=Streptomyces microflavus OX=1919 GN=Smic_78980 PE=4 SV=1 [Streptomyces microflavus]